MPILATIEGTLTVSADPMPSVPIDLYVADDDAPRIALTVTESAATAAAQPHFALGIGLSYDRGDGVMLSFPEVEKVRDFTTSEDADQIGDTMTFKVAGSQYSPFDGRALLLRRGQVIAETVYGFGASEYRAQVFNGFIISSTFEDPPGVASVVCGDAAAKHAEKRAKEYLIPENSGKTRLQITLELLAICGIPHGDLNVGYLGGGLFNKAAAPGDTPVCAWLQAFWRVKGREVGFIDDLFVIHAWDPTRPAVAELNTSNVIGPATSTSPTTLDANVHGVVSVSVTYLDPSVENTRVTLSETFAEYAPVVAETQQTNGVVSSTGRATGAPAMMKIASLMTRETTRGGVVIRSEEVERAWYCPRAARTEMRSTTPAVEYNEEFEEQGTTGTVYIFPDGTTRAYPEEYFLVVRQTIRTKTPDSEGRIIRTRSENFEWRQHRIALFEVRAEIPGTGALHDVPLGGGSWLSVSDDGFGVGSQYGRGLEMIGSIDRIEPGVYFSSYPDQIETTVLTLDGDEIASEVTTRRYPDLGISRRQDGAFRSQLDEPKYVANDAEYYGPELGDDRLAGKTVVTKTYARASEDSYRSTESTREGTSAPRTVVSEHVGSRPRPEMIQQTSSSQEVRALDRDQQRIEFADGEEIIVTEQNEFVQDDAEAAEYARYLARIASAIRVSLGMRFEGQIHKWSPVNVTLPGSGIDGLKFEVRSIQRDGAAHRQQVVAAYYDPALS